MVAVLLSFSTTAFAGLRWIGVRHVCTAPGAGEVTARLDGIPWGQFWEDTCENKISGQSPPNLNQYGASGQPRSCKKDEFSTGIWGEWYREEACEVPLKWGGFKDNGCVKDMEAADVNSGGVSFGGKRSYSSVLWNAGGHWEEACKFSPATIVGPNGTAIAEFEHPTGCVIADADRALSYVVGAVISAGTGLIASPASPKAAAALGAATGQIVATDPTVSTVTFAAKNPSSTVSQCPGTAKSLRGPDQKVTCTCTAAQTSNGNVWGVIPASGGSIEIQAEKGQSSYEGSSRNGVTTGNSSAFLKASAIVGLNPCSDSPSKIRDQSLPGS